MKSEDLIRMEKEADNDLCNAVMNGRAEARKYLGGTNLPYVSTGRRIHTLPSAAMAFTEAARLKHEKGAKEHGQEWSPTGVDYVKEMKDELLDLYNYSTLDDKYLHIGDIAIRLWMDLDNDA